MPRIHARSTPPAMPSIDPYDHFSLLDPTLHHQSLLIAPFDDPVMDLQYILSPSVLLEDDPPPLLFQHDPQPLPVPTDPIPEPDPVPSSSRAAPPAQHVHPNPDDAIISFDSKTRSFPKPTKSAVPTTADPYAQDFLRDMLGPEKWETFSTRLFERRLGGKGKSKANDDDDLKAGASAVEFLVKVEVVKFILREFVPHPYNPRKALSHPYPRAPSGHVTLTRSTVLALCGWSNTQFSYWARRSEAVSVLAEHDPRLRAVGAALERRLRGDPARARDSDDTVTGKGLDSIIEDVKKRTGKSQFLRGKHSSLDPFGTTPQDAAVPPPPPPPYAMPTFRAEHYDHGTRYPSRARTPPSLRPRPPPVSPPAPPKRRLRPMPPDDTESSSSATPTPTTPRGPPSESNVHNFPVSDSRSEVDNPAGAKRKPTAVDADAESNKRARTTSDEES